MNRTSMTVAATLATLAAAAPAHASPGTDAHLALRYSAEASLELGHVHNLAGSPGLDAHRRLVVALRTAHMLEIKAGAAANRSLGRGESSSKAAVSRANQVLARLDAAGRTEAAVVRSSVDDRVEEQAAAGVALNAKLTAALDSRMADVAAGTGVRASISASVTIAQRAPRVIRIVRSLVRTLPAADSTEGRAHIDAAIAVVMDGNAIVAGKLVEAHRSGDSGRDAAVSAALAATQRANEQIQTLVATSHQTGVEQGDRSGADANVQADGSLTIGGVTPPASASSTANAALHAGSKR